MVRPTPTLRISALVAAISTLLIGLELLSPFPSGAAQAPSPLPADHLFDTHHACIACHNGLVTPSGEDVSIGFAWRSSMMANSARDPYWQAAVRREVIDHPEAQAAIEDECSKCHMPMARYSANVNGGSGSVFAHLPIGSRDDPQDLLAADGVSCTLCHQITEEGLGTEESLVGGFRIDETRFEGERAIYGPFEPDDGRLHMMRSATGFRQTESTHIQESELCATCHTLITQTLGPGGVVIGELPEQVPYQEWLHSRYREEQSCQDCHMPVVAEPMPITSVLGEPREGFSRHDFRGSNFFVVQMLNRYRAELGVQALSQELELAAERARRHLAEDSARLTIEQASVRGTRLEANLLVENIAGHKLPTAYPSRRVWLHVTVRDGSGQIVFSSGALTPDGLIEGNDNDADPLRYEPHYEQITNADQVQIYESIMVDRNDVLTTGLLTGLRYIKDNRVLPEGFDKTTAGEDIAVHGSASDDTDFGGGSDRVHYSIDTSRAEGPFLVEAELWYQPIGYRWAENLRPYDAPEPQRLVSYDTSMAASSGVVLARSSVRLD